MANREPVPVKKDKKVFTNTAKNIKKVNIKPKNTRGGIRF